MSEKSQPEGSVDSAKASLDRIHKQLNSSGRVLLQGPLLKRSELLRKWNKRWFTLDPMAGKLEYRLEKGDIAPRGSINFDAGSSILVSPLNLLGSINYNGCCIYIQTLAKKEYFLCAETPKAANAWVSTIRAAVVVLKAHRDALSSLDGKGSSSLGAVAAAVAAANLTAKEAAKDVAQSPAATSNDQGLTEGSMDNLSIMKETLKVKDDELRQMTKEIRARDSTIKDLAQRLSETAEAGEAAVSAARIMDKECQALRPEIIRLREELDLKLQCFCEESRELMKKVSAAERARDDALKEILLWQGELAKAREHAAVVQATLDQEEETRISLNTGLGLHDPGEGTVREQVVSQGKPVLNHPSHMLHTLNDPARTNKSGLEELSLDYENEERKGSP